MYATPQTARAARRVRDRRTLTAAILRLWQDTRAQGMTEYVVLSAVLVLVALWMYHPDNNIFQGIRLGHDRTMAVIANPAP